MDILEYYVFVIGVSGQRWLEVSESEWTTNFHHAAAFNDAELAHDIGEREKHATDTVYVFGLLASR